MKIKKMRTKLILTVIACSTLASAIVGGVSLFKAAQNTKEEATEKLYVLADNVELQLGSQMDLVATAGAQMAAVVEHLLEEQNQQVGLSQMAGNPEAMTSLMNLTLAYAENTSGTISAYVEIDPKYTADKIVAAWYAKEGEAYKSIDMTQMAIADYSAEYSGFAETAASDQRWTEVYYDETLKKQMISYVAPIKLDDQIVGFVGFDIDFDFFKNTVSAVKLYDSGYAFLLDSQNKVLYHPAYELGASYDSIENGAFKAVTDVITNSDHEGDITYRFNQEDRIVCFMKLSNGWVIALEPKYSEIFRHVDETTVFIVLLIAAGSLLFSLVGFAVSLTLVRPILRLKNAFDMASQGDLTVSVPITSIDEIGQASEQFNQMMIQMKTLVTQIDDSCHEVQNASTTLNQISNTTTQAISEIASSMESVSESSSEQAKDMEHILVSSHALGKEINQVADYTVQMNQLAQAVDHHSRQGQSTLQSLVSTTEEKNISSKEIDDAIQANHRSAQEIETILETVIGIAKQTNLLALNASIEAARAGEHGRGFTVVAEEVKKLADESTEAVAEVKRYIDLIQVQSAHAVEVMEGIKVLDVAQSELVNDTEQVFTAIMQQLDELVSRMNDLSNSSNTMNHHKDKTIENIERISASSEEIAASSQEISASTEEGAAALEEVSDLVVKLGAMVDQMQQGIQQFRIK